MVAASASTVHAERLEAAPLQLTTFLSTYALPSSFTEFFLS